MIPVLEAALVPGVLAENLGWVLLALVGITATAVFSGCEIGMFSLSRVRLRIRSHHGSGAAKILSGYVESPARPLEGLLVLQNISGFVFSASVTAILSSYGMAEALQTLVSTLVITPLIILFTEILPKDMFHRYADRWMYKLAYLMRWSFFVLTITLILPAIRVISVASTWVVSRGRAQRQVVPPRTEILQLFQESAATGLVTETQQDLVQRALRMARITIREVMIPWSRVVGVPASISRDGFHAMVRRFPVSRLPVLGKTTTEVLGVVEVLEVLADESRGRGFDVGRHVRTPMTLIGEQSVRSAITLMQRARQTIAVVVDRSGRAIGLVTMKDLVEELIGDVESW